MHVTFTGPGRPRRLAVVRRPQSPARPAAWPMAVDKSGTQLPGRPIGHPRMAARAPLKSGARRGHTRRVYGMRLPNGCRDEGADNSA